MKLIAEVGPVRTGAEAVRAVDAVVSSGVQYMKFQAFEGKHVGASFDSPGSAVLEGVAYAHDRGILAGASVFDASMLKQIGEQLDFVKVAVASNDDIAMRTCLTDWPRDVLVSVTMRDLDGGREAELRNLWSRSCQPHFLFCVNARPATLEAYRRKMSLGWETCHGVSDHTQDFLLAAYCLALEDENAATRGMHEVILEKHLRWEGMPYEEGVPPEAFARFLALAFHRDVRAEIEEAHNALACRRDPKTGTRPKRIF